MDPEENDSGEFVQTRKGKKKIEKVQKTRKPQSEKMKIGRPPKDSEIEVEIPNMEWMLMFRKWLTLYLQEFIRRLKISTLDPAEEKDKMMEWDEEADIQRIRDRLIALWKECEHLDESKIDELSYVIANFGGCISLEFKDQLSQIMLMLIQKPAVPVVQQILSEQGKKKFPFLTLSHERQADLKIKPPEKIKNSLKFFFERMRAELEQHYFKKQE